MPITVRYSRTSAFDKNGRVAGGFAFPNIQLIRRGNLTV